MDEPAAEPLYELLRNMRSPVTLRELMAVCLRHVYTRNPFAIEAPLLQPPARELLEEVCTSEFEIVGIRCVLYSPRAQSKGLMLYMHGGGFVMGSSDDTDYGTRNICFKTGLSVLSINYSLAPEAIFPQALNDCMNVLDWALQKGGMPTDKLLFAGDSAGANLAAAVALQAKRNGLPATGLVMLAPWLDMHVEKYRSYNQLAPAGIVYDAAFIGYCRAAYTGYLDWVNPMVSPIHCNPKELPPTLVLVGTADPLLDQSVRFTEDARAAGCAHIELVIYDGMPHCFYSFPNMFAEEADCYRRIAAFVDALGNSAID